MELKQALKYYLDCGLKFKTVYRQEPVEMIGIKEGIVMTGFYPNNGNDFDLLTKKCKPILYPLDLTKPIWYEGEEIVPIIELAKIEFDDTTSAELIEKFIEDDHEISLEYLPSWFSITFNKGTKLFSRWDDGWGTSPCKYELLFALLKWRIDYFGLIEKGMAIDVGSLKENPYK